MRSRVVILLFLVLVVGCILYIRHYKSEQDYNRKYYISVDEASIERNLKLWLNRDEGMDLNPDIFDLQRLGDTSTYMVLFTLGNNDYGNAQLIQGRNGKLRIKQASYGGILTYDYQDIKTNKGRYYLVMGKNPDLVFDHIEVEVDYKKSYSFFVDVSEDEFFYHYESIPEDQELDERTKIIYYDEDNKPFSDDQLRVIDFN
ncbi:hypothetical protein AB5I83_08875 [Mesobacillus sp. LC4]